MQARRTRQRHRPFLSLFLLLSPHSHSQLFVPFITAQHATLSSRFSALSALPYFQIPILPRSPVPCSLIPRSLPKPHTTCPTAEDTAAAAMVAAVAMVDAATPTGTTTPRQEAERTTTTTTRANTHRTGRTIMPLNTGLAPVDGFLDAPSFLLSPCSSLSARRSSTATALASLTVVSRAGGHALAAVT